MAIEPPNPHLTRTLDALLGVGAEIKALLDEHPTSPHLQAALVATARAQVELATHIGIATGAPK